MRLAGIVSVTILCVVLCGCGTCALMSARLRVLQNGEGEGQQESGEKCLMWSVVICVASDIVRVLAARRMRWTGHVGRVGERRGECMVWRRNVKARCHLTMCRCDDNIKMYLKV